jgi:transcriptional regulator with XRE-family HTH domain
MNFQKSTDRLLERITLEDLADELGVSVQAIRQARTSNQSSAHRAPPSGWASAIRVLANNRMKGLHILIDSLPLGDDK